jgi:ferritin-like metal-binding protein YciE
MEARMTTPRECLLEKLYSAYRLEQKGLRILGIAQEMARLCPRLRARIKEHADETRWQSRLLEVCLENMGEKPGAHRPKWDFLPPAHTGIALKRREIACYRDLIAAAEAANEPDIAQVAREILAQELAMSAWLEDYFYPAASTRIGAMS